MEFYKPQLVLVKNEQDFELLSVTYSDKFNLKALPENTVSNVVTQGELVEITLYAELNQTATEEVENFQCLNPIVHKIDLSGLVTEEVNEAGDFTGYIKENIDVSLFITGSDGGPQRLSGRGRVKTISAGGHLRPILSS